MYVSICLMHAVYSYVFTFMHAVTQFHFSTVTVSAESVSGSISGVSVAWNTTLPPECVTSVTVNFRTTTNGVLVATYTTNSTESPTEIIQAGLRCATSYYIRVVVAGEARYQGVLLEQFLSSSPVRVFVRGKEIVCIGMKFQSQELDGGCVIAQIYQPQLE